MYKCSIISINTDLPSWLFPSSSYCSKGVDASVPQCLTKRVFPALPNRKNRASSTVHTEINTRTVTGEEAGCMVCLKYQGSELQR